MAECSDSSIANNSSAQNKSQVQVPLTLHEDDKTEKEMEAVVVLVEDTTTLNLPRSYRNLEAVLTARLQHTPLTKHEIAVALVHLLFLEAGFVNASSKTPIHTPYYTFNYPQLLSESRRYPEPFKLSETVFEINLKLGVLPDACKLVVNFLGNDIIVNCHVPSLKKYYSVIVDLSTHIVFSRNFVHFQDMPSFSRLIKTQLCYYAKCDILEENKLPFVSLVTLPWELYEKISSYLSETQKIALSYSMYLGKEVETRRSDIHSCIKSRDFMII